MKKGLLIVAIALAVVIGYVAAGPYLAVEAIKTGIVENNHEKLSENIEIVTLRNNLLDQLNEAITKFADAGAEQDPFAAFAATLASRYVGSVANSIVAPSGLAAYMEGRVPPGNSAEPAGKAPSKDSLLKNGSYSYDSASEFSISVPNEMGGKATFVLQRKGLTWKLVNLVLPVNVES
jgi:hypothetical protein